MNNEPKRKHIEVIITCACGYQLHYHIGKPCPSMPFTVYPCPHCTTNAELSGFDRAARVVMEGGK